MTVLDINDILDILPHRYPFLLIDRVIEHELGRRLVAIKNVTINEEFFIGHFPGHPVMPGVLTLEAMAQACGILMLSLDGLKGKLAYFASIEKARFRRPVQPGDQLRMEIDVIKIRGIVGKMRGKALVDGKVVAEAEMTFTLIEGDRKVQIDKTATIHPSAELGKDIKIGPHVYIGEGVRIGNGTIIDANAVIEKWTTIGEDCHIHYGAIIGNTTQDKKYQGEKSYVIIGDRNDIREYVTINRATAKEKATIIGNDNLLLTHSHVAHDSILGNGIVLSNAVNIAGHAHIEDFVIVGGMSGIIQFARIGKMAMIGGYSKINQDIPPFMLVEGNPGMVRSLNIVGLTRRGTTAETMGILKKAYKLLYRSNMNTSQAVEQMKKTLSSCDELTHLIKFLKEETEKGLTRGASQDSTPEEVLEMTKE